MAASKHGTSTVRLLARLAVFAGMAHILNRFVACPLADLVALDPITDFDDNACTLEMRVSLISLFVLAVASDLVACTLGAQLGHLGQFPVVQHEVHVGEAEACGVELDEDLVGFW